MEMIRSGPVIVGEFRGGKAEVFQLFDKTDKNAPPIDLGMFKLSIELLADGTPVIVTVFLERGVNAEQFASTVQLKRGDIIAIAVNKLEMKSGVRRASCAAKGFTVLDKSEVEQLRG